MNHAARSVFQALCIAAACGLSSGEAASPVIGSATRPSAGTAIAPSATQPASNAVFTADSLKDFYARLVQRTDENWRGDHWVHQRKGYDWVHANTSIYYILRFAQMTGDVSRIDKIKQHYDYSKRTWWVADPGCWINSDHEVMGNACTDLSIASGLLAGAKFLPDDLRTEMEGDLKSSLRWLEHKTTGALNDADLRACNQDCCAAAAFAQASAYFGNDPELRRMALDRLRLILAKSQGPFWTEGGVDKGYQMVGESPFALAADRLWSDLTDAEKRRIAEILMRPIAAPTLGLEKMRSESTLGKELDGNLASPILHRVWNPWIARDVIATMIARQPLDKTFEYFDTPQVAYYEGVLANAPALAAFNQPLPDLGWGGTARLGMNLDEYGGRGSVDEKTFITSATGFSALFGDISGWNPKYALTKRKATELQEQFNPGGLRYAGQDRTVITWAESKDDFPRLVFGDGVQANGAPKLVSEETRVGFIGSQYHLVQSLTHADGTVAGNVDQRFVIVGNTLLMRFEPDAAADLPNLRYELTIPTTRPTVDPKFHRVAWIQSSLHAGDPDAMLQFASLHGGDISWDPTPLKPFLQHEAIRHWFTSPTPGQENITPDHLPLTRAIVPIGRGVTWAALSMQRIPPAGASSVGFAIQVGADVTNDLEQVTVSEWLQEYKIMFVPPGRAVPATIGHDLQLDRPAAGVFQVFSLHHRTEAIIKERDSDELLAFNVAAGALREFGQPVFTSDDKTQPADVSLLRSGRITAVNVAAGHVTLAPSLLPSMQGTSMIFGNAIDGARALAADRVVFAARAAE